MFSAFQTFGRLGAGARAVSAAWSPLALWPDGASTPGLWISPRTLASSFADSAGTTPVATPGTVADTSNPVGLALDIRAGATALADPGNHMLQATSPARPLLSARVNLLTYTGDLSGWNKDVGVTITPNYGTAPDSTSTSIRVQFDGANEQVFLNNLNGGGNPGILSLWIKGASGETLQVAPDFGYSYPVTFTGAWQQVENYSAVANAFSLSTYAGSTARDVEVWHPQFQIGLTATDYQSVPGDGSTYASGPPIAQKYDGVDDGMATAAFSAGTLTSGMDCMIAVRRDSAGACVAGLYNGVADATKFFGMAESGSGSGCVGSGAGTPTVWVDGTQLAGGTAVTRGTLHTALTVGDVHILEFRGLDLSTWASSGFGLYTGYLLPGARGDILLFPSTTPTADKAAARQWLADYYGVTLA